MRSENAAVPYICPSTTATVAIGGVDIQEHPKMINIGLLGVLEYDS